MSWQPRMGLFGVAVICLSATACAPPSAREEAYGSTNSGADVQRPADHSGANDHAADVRPAGKPRDLPSDERAAGPSDSSGTPQAGSIEAMAREHERAELGDEEVLFEGWPEPSAVLFITGQQHGYIEPCGCTGLSNQKGGLVRRHTFYRQLIDRGWSVIPVDAGNQVRRFGRQAEIKFQMTIEGMKKMGYRAIGWGADDLRLSSLELVAVVAGDGSQETPFVNANVTILDPSLMPKYRVVEAGGKKIGITAVLGDDWQENITGQDVSLTKAAEALPGVISEMEAAGCDVRVLLANASIEESRRLATAFPQFQIVVTAGSLGDPTYQPEILEPNGTLLVQTGIKGMYVGILGIFDGDPWWRYQRVPLDARFEDSREMLQLLASYQNQLKELGLEGLGIRAVPHPSGWTYVGSEACEECHSYEYEVWESSNHAHALESLVNPGERSEVPRHFDPECLSCHVVGWNPQQFFPYVSGYLGLEETPLAYHVGCENCHGPGSAHVAAENGDVKLTDEQIDAIRAAARLPLEEAEKHCLQCHDLDNSPDFHEDGAFDEYWEQIEH